MPKKLTTAVATDMVQRIESLQEQIEAVYREANGYDGMRNSNVIRDAVKHRKEARDAAGDADGLLASFDVEE